MANQRLPSNGFQRKQQGPSLNSKAQSTPVRTQYRESTAGHSGRTSSGKGMTGAKAGRGSCTGY